MKPCSPTIVHRLLAQLHGSPIDQIHDDLRLGLDLGLDLFDLLIVGARIEEREAGRGAFPVEAFDSRMTVGQLDAMYRSWSSRREEPAVAIATGGSPPQRRVRAAMVCVDEVDTQRVRETLRAAQWSSPPSVRGAPHVLVAEDDAEMRAFLATSLRADGYRVSEVTDGVELLRATTREALGEAGYDVIVSDVLMPGVSGLGALMQLNYEPAAPPVVLITAFGDPDVHLWAQQLGAVATFDKPFDVDDLKTVLLNVRGARGRGGWARPAQPSVGTP